MIGDADGNTDEEVILSKDNPHIERYCTLLNSLKPTKGTWGVCLERRRIDDAFKEGQFTEDDYKFLLQTMFEDEEADDAFIEEFYEGVRCETEYSFLVFEGVTLLYTDENGEQHETEFTK